MEHDTSSTTHKTENIELKSINCRKVHKKV